MDTTARLDAVAGVTLGGMVLGGLVFFSLLPDPTGAEWGLTAGGTGGGVLVQAAEEPPEERWRWSSPETILDLTGRDETVVVTTDDAVVALSADGRERWTSTAGARVLPTEAGTLVERDGEVVGLGDAGEERWRSLGTLLDITPDLVLLRQGDRLAAVEVDTGDERYSVPLHGNGDAVVADDALYLCSGGQVSRYDLADGHKDWSSPVNLTMPADPSPGPMPRLGVSGDLVVVTAADARGFEAGSGDPVFHDRGVAAPTAGTGIGGGTVVVTGVDAGETVTRAYTEDGLVAETEDPDLGPWAVVDYAAEPLLVTAGGEYVDAGLDAVARPDGLPATADPVIAPVEQGYLALVDGEVSLVDLDGEVRWSVESGLASGSDSRPGLIATEGGFCAAAGSELVCFG